MPGSIIIIHNCEPMPSGHGGNHRSYQTAVDAETVVGKVHVHSMMAMPWWEDNPIQPKSSRVLGRLADRVKRRAISYSENPYKMLALTGLATRGTLHPNYVSHYHELVKQLPRPVVSIIENAAYAPLVSVNRREAIPTVICPQNLEGLHGNLRFLFPAFEAYASQQASLRTSWGISSSMLDLGNELRVLARCTERLFISQVETGIVGGVGLSSRHYQYLPVGEIDRRLRKIRAARIGGGSESGFFLLAGNALHLPTGESLRWFVDNAQAHGIPEGICVVVVGGGTAELLPLGVSVPGLQLRGWVSDEEFDDLLVRSSGALLPQQFGLGAVTRLPEYACAGLPILALPHVSYAHDVVPGVLTIERSWMKWCEAMVRVSETGLLLRGHEYDAWEQGQTRTLQDVLRRLLSTS